MARDRRRKPKISDHEPRLIANHGGSLNHWDEIALWQRDNEYILSGYRPSTGSFIECYRSLGYLHNETVNIYSHLVGAAIFLLIPIYLYIKIYSQLPRASAADLVVFSTFCYGVALCFLLSSTYHIISNHSPMVQKIGNQLDYLGIIILMWGSTIPSIYYGFYCDSQLQRFYWINVSALATLCIVATLHPSFRHPTFRPYRAAMYAGLGLSTIGFVYHGLRKYGWETQNQRMSLDWMLLMATTNLVGAVTYSIRYPEKLHPYVYDIYGSSHQVLHIAVVVAGLSHMFGLVRASRYVHSDGSVCT